MNKRENIPGKQSNLGEKQRLRLPVVHLGSSLVILPAMAKPDKPVHPQRGLRLMAETWVEFKCPASLVELQAPHLKTEGNSHGSA